MVEVGGSDDRRAQRGEAFDAALDDVAGLEEQSAALGLPTATPPGAPVENMSPGSIGMWREKCSTMSGSFQVGHWDVFSAAGKKVGENRIELIADGCALLEEWSGNGGVTGKSLNIYDPAIVAGTRPGSTTAARC